MVFKKELFRNIKKSVNQLAPGYFFCWAFNLVNFLTLLRFLVPQNLEKFFKFKTVYLVYSKPLLFLHYVTLFA